MVAFISEINFRFKVTKISTLEEIFSPELVVSGIPWNIHVSQAGEIEKHRLDML